MNLIRKVKNRDSSDIFIGRLKLFSYKRNNAFWDKISIKSLISSICRLFPVQKNKILCISYSGGSYACNPRYLIEYLLKHHPGEFDIAWMFLKKATIPAELPPQIRPVRYPSIKWFYEVATAGVIINNGRIPPRYGVKRRPQQQYIQTWHGTMGLKMVEKDAESSLPVKYAQHAQWDSKQTSHFISGNTFSSKLFRRAFWYDGPILECGTPRIDYLLNAAANRTELCHKAQLKPDCRYILYAPTFRKDLSLDAYSIDMERLANAMKQRFGGEWLVLFRLHPNAARKMGEMNLPACCVDVTKHQDMQELLVISEVLVTDYSSCMFDMAYCGKISLLYATDIKEYTGSDRGLYFDIYKLPFPLAQNNDELEDIISQFNKEEYYANVQAFLEKEGNYEKGIACKTIAKLLLGAGSPRSAK